MVNPNEDTEFNDALRAQGILPPKPPSRSPSPDIPHITQADAVRAIAATADADQLDTLLEGDGLDSDDERMFESYRRKRLQEMRQDERKGRYGTLEPLGREDFVKLVTEGSKKPASDAADIDDEDEDDDDVGGIRTRSGALRGTGVVVFLFKDSVPLSQYMRPLLQQIAAAHPSTRFFAIPAGLCIPNYPDKNVPTLLVYRNGDVRGNVVAGAGLNGLKTTVRELEALLCRYTALEGPSSALRTRHADSGDEYEEDNIGAVNARAGGLRGGRGRQAPDSDDSELDM